jgi:uncharacterized protein YbcI
MSGPNGSRSRTELQMQISRVLIQFEKEFMGRGPLETKAYLIDDMIFVRLKGVLTAAERKLCASQSDRSSYLLKQVRNELLASGRPLLEGVIRDIVGVDVQSIHTDISTKTGERIIVITLEQPPILSDAHEQASADDVCQSRESELGSGNANDPTPPRHNGHRRPALH